MKKQYARTIEAVERERERERERESYALENKGLLSEPQKYRKKDSNAILVSKIDTG